MQNPTINTTLIGISKDELKSSLKEVLKEERQLIEEKPSILTGADIYKYLHISKSQFKRDFDDGEYEHCCRKVGGRYYFDPKKFI